MAKTLEQVMKVEREVRCKMAKHPSDEHKGPAPPAPPTHLPEPPHLQPPAQPQGQPPAAPAQPPPPQPPPPDVAPGAPDQKTREAMERLSKHEGELPEPKGKGTYLVRFEGGEPPVAVEAEGPEEARKAAMERLGIRASERPPSIQKVP